MNSKIFTREEIIAQFHDGQTIAIGGQANHGSPNRLIQCLIDSNAKHLTIISIDSGDMDVTIGRLIHRGMVDELVTTHIGRNAETVALYDAGKLKVDLNPMGSFIERVRCGGMGLGGVLTKTGIGTVAAEGKKIITVDERDYILETPLTADISLTRARKADPLGNLCYHGTGENSNPIIATVGEVSIVEADMLFDLGELQIDEIKLPCAFVDMILENQKDNRNG